MKIQLALLLVVLFVSLPSVVFSQPPLGAVQSGETSQIAPTAETVEKSWEGPVFGLGLGLGRLVKAPESTPLVGMLPVRGRLGYGIRPNKILYGSVFTLRALGSGGEWSDLAGVLGVMFPVVRDIRDTRKYGFFAVGATFSGDPRALYIRGGSGIEVHPGLSVEGACTLEGIEGGGFGNIALVLDLTLNYHFY